MYALFFGILFIQFGITYYISIQTLLLLFIIRFYKFKRLVLQILALFIFIFFIKYIYLNMNFIDFLRTFREWIIFSLILVSTQGFKKIDLFRLIQIIKLLLIIIFIMVVVQKISIIFFQSMPRFPIEYYIVNTGTLTGIDIALEYGTRIRPIGFYGEPSYMSFITLILYLLVLTYNHSNKIIFFDILTFLIIALSESVSGIIVFIVIQVYQYKNIFFKKKYIPYLLITCILLITFISKTEISTRILNSLHGEIDPSFYIRLFEPINILIKMLEDNYYFGISITVLDSYMNQLNIKGIDNGLYNLVFSYGYLSLLILIIIYYFIKNTFLFSIFLLLIFFNGAVFSIDKGVLFALLFGTIKTIELRRKEV